MSLAGTQARTSPSRSERRTGGAARRRVRSAALPALLIGATLAVPLLGARVATPDAYGLPSAGSAPDFELRTVEGETATLEDFRDRYVYLMFGYLNCPDVCHTQALLFEELQLLAGADLPLSFIYVAIDPERDTPAEVARYFDHRGESFVSLHADSVRDLQALANRYHAYFRRGHTGTASAATIDHNALFFLIGPDGQLRYTYAATQNATPRLAADLQGLHHHDQTRSRG